MSTCVDVDVARPMPARRRLATQLRANGAMLALEKEMKRSVPLRKARSLSGSVSPAGTTTRSDSGTTSGTTAAAAAGGGGGGMCTSRSVEAAAVTAGLLGCCCGRCESGVLLLLLDMAATSPPPLLRSVVSSFSSSRMRACFVAAALPWSSAGCGWSTVYGWT